MNARWKGLLLSVAVAGFVAAAFVFLFYGINLDDGMVVHQVTRKGALWVGMDGDHNNKYLEPLPHFLAGAAFATVLLWFIAICLLGPLAWIAGYAWERRRSRVSPPS